MCGNGCAPPQLDNVGGRAVAMLARAASRAACASERAEAGRWLRAHRRAVVAYVITAAARSGTTGDPSLRGPKAAELFSSSGLERVR